VAWYTEVEFPLSYNTLSSVTYCASPCSPVQLSLWSEWIHEDCTYRVNGGDTVRTWSLQTRCLHVMSRTRDCCLDHRQLPLDPSSQYTSQYPLHPTNITSNVTSYLPQQQFTHKLTHNIAFRCVRLVKHACTWMSISVNVNQKFLLWLQ